MKTFLLINEEEQTPIVGILEQNKHEMFLLKKAVKFDDIFVAERLVELNLVFEGLNIMLFESGKVNFFESQDFLTRKVCFQDSRVGSFSKYLTGLNNFKILKILRHYIKL